MNQVLEENTFLNLKSIQTRGKISFVLAVPISILLGILSGLGVAFIVSFIESNSKKEEIRE